MGTRLRREVYKGQVNAVTVDLSRTGIQENLMKDNTVSSKLSRLTILLFALVILAITISFLIGYDSGTQAYYRSPPGGDVRVEEIGMITAVIYGFKVAVISVPGFALYLFVVYLLPGSGKKIAKCANCGFTNSTNALVCRICGKKLY